MIEARPGAPDPPIPFVGAVLTGGASTRMGTDKAFIEVDGVPLVRRIADALTEAGASHVLAIGGDVARLRALGLDARADRWPGLGPLAGIVTALEEAVSLAADVTVVAACDLVHLDAAAIRELLAAVTPDADAVIPRTDRLEPLMAVYRTRAVDHLRGELDAGERAPHRAVEGLTVAQVRLQHADALRDADTPGDLPIA